jgi:hypothetical protein
MFLFYSCYPELFQFCACGPQLFLSTSDALILFLLQYIFPVVLARCTLTVDIFLDLGVELLTSIHIFLMCCASVSVTKVLYTGYLLPQLCSLKPICLICDDPDFFTHSINVYVLQYIRDVIKIK